MAQDDDGLVGVELLMGAGGDFTHGHEQGSGECSGLELPGLADVEQDEGELRGVGLVTQLEVGLGGDLGIEHKA